MKKKKTNHTADAQDETTAAPSSLQPKRWKNGKPPPDHPMWQELWQASEQAWARMSAQGELDNWKEESTLSGDFRKGNPRKT
ncbi:MAG: hypothetical protein OXG09_01910 [Chloroflexi bacterium]|nr:hypothetical protein [Chloroflexota bacterium]